MSSIRSAGPTVRNAIRSTRVNAGRNSQRRNYQEDVNNKQSGSNKNPSGEIPWVLGAAAFAVPAGVWFTARTTGHERDNLGEVAIGPAAERLKATYHRDFEHPSKHIGQAVENGKDAFSHMTGVPRRGPDLDFRSEANKLRRDVEDKADSSLKSAEGTAKSWFGSFGRAKDETYDYAKDKTNEASRFSTEAEHRANDTLRSAEDKTKSFFGSLGRRKDDSFDYAKDKGNEASKLSREAEERAESTFRAAENKTKSWFGTFGRATDDSLDYVKDRASEAEQKLYDAFNKPATPRKGNYTFEHPKEHYDEHHEKGSTFPGTNIPRAEPHGDYRGERSRRTSKDFESAIEGPPIDSPNKAPTVPSSDEHKITNAHHRRLYAKDAANMYPEKSKKGEGVLDTARLTVPVNSWTRPLRGNASKEEPPKHE